MVSDGGPSGGAASEAEPGDPVGVSRGQVRLPHWKSRWYVREGRGEGVIGRGRHPGSPAVLALGLASLLKMCHYSIVNQSVSDKP